MGLYGMTACGEADVCLFGEAMAHVAELRVVLSARGHRAAARGTDSRDIAFFDAAIRDLLAM
jgi:hypothetical protein